MFSHLGNPHWPFLAAGDPRSPFRCGCSITLLGVQGFVFDEGLPQNAPTAIASSVVARPIRTPVAVILKIVEDLGICANSHIRAVGQNHCE